MTALISSSMTVPGMIAVLLVIRPLDVVSIKPVGIFDLTFIYSCLYLSV